MLEIRISGYPDHTAFLLPLRGRLLGIYTHKEKIKQRTVIFILPYLTLFKKKPKNSLIHSGVICFTITALIWLTHAFS